MDVGRGKVAYIWISPDPVRAGLTLGGGVVCARANSYVLTLDPIS